MKKTIIAALIAFALCFTGQAFANPNFYTPPIASGDANQDQNTDAFGWTSYYGSPRGHNLMNQRQFAWGSTEVGGEFKADVGQLAKHWKEMAIDGGTIYLGNTSKQNTILDLKNDETNYGYFDGRNSANGNININDRWNVPGVSSDSNAAINLTLTGFVWSSDPNSTSKIMADTSVMELVGHEWSKQIGDTFFKTSSKIELSGAIKTNDFQRPPSYQ